MGEELSVALAEPIEARLSVAVGEYAVFGTFAVASEEVFTLSALTGQQLALLPRKILLACAV